MLKHLGSKAPQVGFVLISVVLAIYCLHLPSTVQLLDTGELVSSAYNLTTAHPPGYPLYMWLQHLFTKALPFGPVFFRAALLNALLSSAILTLLFVSVRRQLWVAATLVLTLAFSSVYWRYTELPDVFMLNALFVAAISYLYLFVPESSRRTSALVVTLAIALTNHLTALFLAPLVIHSMIRERQKKKAALAVALGAILFIGLYASLLLTNSSSFYSWGNVSSVKALAAHFLRKDYGTLQLAPKDQGFQLPAILLRLSTHLLSGFIPALALMGLSLNQSKTSPKKDERLLVFSGTLALYSIVFFSLANVDPIGAGEEILDRFFVMTFVLISFLSAYLASKAELNFGGKLRIVGIGLILISAAGIFRFHQHNDFSKNTIIEDYAINYLNSVDPKEPSAIVVKSDTKLFALNYVQSVLNVRPDILVISAPMLSVDWYWQKLKARDPSLVINEEKLTGPTISLSDGLFNPNIQKYRFFFTEDFASPNDFKMTVNALGRKIEPGSGIAFNEASVGKLQFRSTINDFTPTEGYDPYKQVFADYAHYYLALGSILARNGQLERGQQALQQALVIVPYCIPAMEKLCKIEQMTQANPQSCFETLEAMKDKEVNYF